MIAVDTNILVRLIVGDDPDQVRRALALSTQDTFFVSLTVLIETEWVLRSRFDMAREEIVAALWALGDLVPLVFEHDRDARWAIERYARVGELADYVHIVAARAVGRFATFETRLARRAGPDAPAIIEVPA